MYKKLIENYKEPLIKTLKEFIAIHSVLDPLTIDEENPFGKGVSSALQYIEKVAREDGFEVHNYDNMVVEILCGKGDKNITILAHADVVPEGTGWSHDPFDLYEEDGVLYGRGVSDDKGPLLAAYYGMKMLRDNNMLGDYVVRFIVGGNEESGSLGVHHYFYELNKPQPDFGFSPDAEYPLIFAEKGIISFEVKKDFEIPGLIYLKGGVAHNSVIEKCVLKFNDNEPFINYLKTNNIDHEYDGNEIIFLGKAAHGATPELGVNAGMNALTALNNFYDIAELKQVINAYSDLKAKGLSADSYSEDMGNCSLNVGIINYENNHFTLTANYRYVDNCVREEMIENIKNANSLFSFEILDEGALLYYSKDSELVSTLLNVYQQETGDFTSKPLAIGGGTYAKEARNTIAFGMEFPGWDSRMHSPGERAKKEDLFTSMAIYARAIIDLGKKLS